MNDGNRRDGFEARIAATLDESVRDLDPGVAARLREARRRALQSDRRVRWPSRRALAAGAVALLLAAVAVWRMPATIDERTVLQDLDVLSAAEAIDFYDELEFYAWLESEHEQG